MLTLEIASEREGKQNKKKTGRKMCLCFPTNGKEIKARTETAKQALGLGR